MTALTIIIPALPPSVNHMYTPNGRGGKVLSQEARAFREQVILEARSTANAQGWRVPTGGLQFGVKLTFPNKKISDIDNRIKAAIDAVALAFGFNDTRIERIIVERVGVEPGRPLCELLIAPMGERWLVADGDIDRLAA